MMKSIYFIFLLGGLMMLSYPTQASPDSTSGGLLHTPTLHKMELKPASLDGAYQTAAVCFLGVGDCDPNIGHSTGDEDMNIDTANQCKNEGFVLNNCNSVQDAEGICPYNKSYIKGCKCKTSLITCTSPKYGVGTACGGKYASCTCPATVSMSYPNDRCTQTCDGNCITKTCSKTSNETGCSYGTQSCNDGCGGNSRSCCKPCYPYSSESGCSYGTEPCSNGCGGTRNCCKSAPPCDYCSVHGNCHGDCCHDGSIASCDSRCGGSGCYTPPPPPPPPAREYWGGFYYSNGDGWCSTQSGGGYAFVYSVTQGCRNRDTGEEHAIKVTSQCYTDGTRYSTKAECQAKGTYGWSGYYGTECVDPWTMPRGTTSC